MFRQLDDFFKSYSNLTAGTKKILGVLTDESLARQVAEGHRTLGQIGWHIVTTVPEMMSRTGLPLSSIDHHSPPPPSAAGIAASYHEVSNELVAAIRDNWNDASLRQEDDMYGEKWPRGLSLAALVGHEAHHVGQMTVLLRQAGLRVPGIYGPAKEEWAQYGMPEPPY